MDLFWCWFGHSCGLAGGIFAIGADIAAWFGWW